MNCICYHFPNLSIERYGTLKFAQNKKITKAHSNTQNKKKTATGDRVNGPRALTRCNTKCCNNNHFVNISRIRAVRQLKGGTSSGSVLPLKKVKADAPSEKKNNKISTRGKMKATNQSHLSVNSGHGEKKSSMLPNKQLTGRSNAEERGHNGSSDECSGGSEVASRIGSSVGHEVGTEMRNEVGGENRSEQNARIMKNSTHQKFTGNNKINPMEKNKSKSCSLRNIMDFNSAPNKDIHEDTSNWDQLCENEERDPDVYTPSNELLDEKNIWECAKGETIKKRILNNANVYTVRQNEPSLSIEEKCPLVGKQKDMLLGGDETEDPLKMNGTGLGEMLISKKSYLIAALANMPRGENKNGSTGGTSGLSIGLSSDRSSGRSSEHCSGRSSEHGSAKDEQKIQGSQTEDMTNICDDMPLLPIEAEECKKAKKLKDEEYAKKNLPENILMYNLLLDIYKGSNGVKNNEGGVLLNLENLGSPEVVKKSTSSRKEINHVKEKMSSILHANKGKKQDPTCAGGNLNCNNQIGLLNGDAVEGHSEKSSEDQRIEQMGEHESEPRDDMREDQMEHLRNQLNHHLYKKLTDDTITESTNNTCSDFNESTHNNSSTKSTKFLFSMNNEEERELCEKITLPKSTTNSAVNSVSVYMDSSSSMSDGSLFNDVNRNKSNITEYEKKENASHNVQKRKDCPNTTPMKRGRLINHTAHDKSSSVMVGNAVPSSPFPIHGKIINLVGNRQVQHADKENKKDPIEEEPNKTANLKRRINQDDDCSLKKKLKIGDYSLLNLNIYKNTSPELYENNSYNMYILKSLQESYFKNKLFSETYSRIRNISTKKEGRIPSYVENSPFNSAEKYNSKSGSTEKYDEAEGWDFIRLTNNEMDEKINAEEMAKMKRKQINDMNSYYNDVPLNGMACPQATQLINVDNNACRSSPLKEQNFSATYKGDEEADDHFNTIYTNEENYSNLLKEKQLDSVHLHLRDIIKLLENERIGNLYSEEELESIILPVAGIYYDSGRQEWLYKYDEGDKMTNMRSKIWYAQNYSYHQSRQMALQQKYNYIRKKYNIFTNVDDEERMFLVCIRGHAKSGGTSNGGAPTEGNINQRVNAHQGKNTPTKVFNEYDHGASSSYGCIAKKPGQRRIEMCKEKVNPKELQPEGEEAEEINHYQNGTGQKRRPFCCINKSPSDIREANLNDTINPLSVQVPPSTSSFSSHEGTHGNRTISSKGKEKFPSFNIINAKKDVHNSVGEFKKNNIKEISFPGGVQNASIVTQNGDPSGEYIDRNNITSKTRSVLYKTLGVEFSNDFVDRIHNLPKENVYYERDKKRWVIKIIEKKTNTLLYFKEFDCTVFGFIYACILTIEHKQLYLDYFLNEKNYDFLMQLIQNSPLKKKFYFNSAVQSTGLGSNGNLPGDNTFFMEGVNEEASIESSAEAGAELNYDVDRQRIKSGHNPNVAYLVETPDTVLNDRGISRFGEYYQEEKLGRENSTMHNNGTLLSKLAQLGNIFVPKIYPSKNDLQATKNDMTDRRKMIPSLLQNQVDGEYFTNAVGTNACGGNAHCSRGNNKEMNCLQRNFPQKEWCNGEQFKRAPREEHHITERGQKNKTLSEGSQNSFLALMEKMQLFLPHVDDNNESMVINNVRSDCPSKVASPNGNTDTLSPHSGFQNSENLKDGMINANETDDKCRKKTRQTNQMKAKKDPPHLKRTKNSKDAVANGKESTLMEDLMQEETNNLLKLDSYIEALDNNGDAFSLAKETILLLLKSVIYCIPFQMAPSVISRKIYYQKINAHVKFVYHSETVRELMPYFFIFKNVIKEKIMPTDQSLYMCNVMLYALFEA
ncbi:Uncharacterized protein PCOAH_00039170 [Plasmodium coatneyi]|uniref:AP2-coincident C-terminal domain-containing protein n=1 Tax=Plasmodium coatneyi TaxID=208452 RepID=A0A1B1E380_9APIC|nr:Uncharacterized protein PCOAH_00039170 [Plasmodium coatneyi]ANQ09453.1 Uncharacterized protein PCOAH_00039170 [Plasmodium coatneyi]